MDAAFLFGHVWLGGKLPQTSFRQLETSHSGDTAFTRFHIKLTEYFRQYAPEALQQSERRTIRPDDTVSLRVLTTCTLISISHEP